MSQSVSFDPVADRYDEARVIPTHAVPVIATGLLRLGAVPARGGILEIGIGTGRISLPLLAEGVNVTGVDIAPRMVERLRTKYEHQRQADPARGWGDLTTIIADITALPCERGTFDAAIAVHVLHLVPEWRRALDEALRTIRPGGAFLLGQEQRESDDMHHRMQSQWLDIVNALGYPATYPGAGYDTIVSELRRRGLSVDERILAEWEIASTPRGALREITERTWSRTWDVPDDVFEESVRRLTASVERMYGGGLDTPQHIPISFKVARARSR